MGSILRDAEKPKEEEIAYRDALAIRRELSRDFPTSAECCNGLAWILATCPLEQLRDTGKAVELSNRAVGLDPSVGNYWNTLGVARYRAGKWKEAVEALTKSMELNSGGDVVDWLFLAMAHQHLGHQQQARRWHDRAAVALENDLVMDQSRRLFLAETAHVLGLTDPTPKGKLSPR